MKEKEVNESLVLAGVKPESIGEIERVVNANSAHVRSNLSGMRLRPVEYSNLEWRVDVNLASRATRETVEPEIVLKLDLKSAPRDNNNNDNDDDDEDTDAQADITSEILKTDVVNLVHMTNCLDEALNEIKTHYVRRVMKNIV